MRREFAVGLLFLIAIAALSFMVNRLTSARSLNKGGRTYYAYAQNSAGLPVGAVVRVAGIDVGRLRKKELRNNQAFLTIEVSVSTDIHKDAKITLRSIGYLGDRYLDLNPGTEEFPPLQAGSTIALDESTTLEGLMEQGSNLMQAWTSVAQSLDALLGVRH